MPFICWRNWIGPVRNAPVLDLSVASCNSPRFPRIPENEELALKTSLLRFDALAGTSQVTHSAIHSMSRCSVPDDSNFHQWIRILTTLSRHCKVGLFSFCCCCCFFSISESVISLETVDGYFSYRLHLLLTMSDTETSAQGWDVTASLSSHQRRSCYGFGRDVFKRKTGPLTFQFNYCRLFLVLKVEASVHLERTESGEWRGGGTGQ